MAEYQVIYDDEGSSYLMLTICLGLIGFSRVDPDEVR